MPSKNRTMGIRLEPELRGALDTAAARLGITPVAFVRHLIIQELGPPGDQPKPAKKLVARSPARSKLKDRAGVTKKGAAVGRGPAPRNAPPPARPVAKAVRPERRHRPHHPTCTCFTCVPPK